MAGVLGRFKPDFDDVDCFRDPLHHAVCGHLKSAKPRLFVCLLCVQVCAGLCVCRCVYMC